MVAGQIAVIGNGQVNHPEPGFFSQKRRPPAEDLVLDLGKPERFN
jgi:hypothetical protein